MLRHFFLPIAACLVVLASASARGGEARSQPELRYREPCEVVEVVSEQAPVKLFGTVVATVERGERFGVRRRRGDLFEIQVAEGAKLRRGWLEPRHAKLLTNRDIDLATEALQIAKELDPEVDVGKWKAKVDAITKRVTAAAGDDKPLGAKLRAVSRVLFREEGLRFERAARTLDAVLAGKRGNCLGLSTLYLCVTRELRLPLYMVAVPDHVFVRYDDGKQQLNLEVTMGGVVIGDAYVAARRLKPGSPSPGMLSHLEVVGILRGAAGVELADRGKHTEASKQFGRVAELAPLNAENYHNWGTSLLVLKQKAQACDKFARAVQLHPRHAPALYTWAVALAMLDEHEWACEKFARAVEADPRSARAYFNWGLTLLEMGRRAEGFAKLEKAAALSPGFGPRVEQLRQHLDDTVFDNRTWQPTFDDPW